MSKKQKQWYLMSVKHMFANSEQTLITLAEYLDDGWEPFGATSFTDRYNGEGFYYHLRKYT